MTGPRQPRPSARSHGTVTITTAADGLSEAINLTGLTLCSISMSTGWTAGRLAFLGNCDGSTVYKELRIPASTLDSSVLAMCTTANQMLMIDPNLFHGVQAIQLISIATASTAVAAQAAGRLITLGLSEVTKRS